MNPQAMNTALSCGLALVFAVPAFAQQPTSTPANETGPDVASVFSNSFGMDFVDGALRAGGPGYKAIFDTAGMEYTPALGEVAPQNYPVRFTLSSIRRGAQTLYDAATARKVTPQQQGMVASYARGRSIVETFEARADGVKQNYTFASAPAGTGDLVVECQLTTQLAGSPGDCSQGLSLQMPGIGGVEIGAVVGIDADGRRSSGSMSFDSSMVRFVLPAAYVDQAAYPMVLDPIIGTTALINTLPAKDPDVAFDETFDDYLVVWEHQFSQLDIDVRAQKVDTAGALVATQIIVSGQSGLEINPSVGNVDAGSDYFVAYQEGPSPFGPWDIRGRRVDGGSGTTTSAVLDIAATAANEITPDISGDNTSVSGTLDGCIIVFDDSTGITAVKVDVSTATVVAGPLTLSPASTTSRPTISKSGGSDGRHLVMWDQQFPSNRDVRGALVDRDLNVLDGSITVEGSVSRDAFNADIDGDGTEWLVAFQQSESGNSGPCDVYCRRLVWNGSGVATPASAELLEGAPGIDERDPAIGYLGSKYVAAWAVQFAGLNYDIVVVELTAETCLPCGQRQFTFGGGLNIVDLNPEIATRYSGRSSTQGNITFDQGMIVWMDTSPTPPFEGDLVANLYEAFGGGAVVDLGGGCGPAGTNGVNGPIALGNSDFRLTVSGASGDLLLVSIMFTNSVASCGGCQINDDPGTYIFAPGVGGNSSLALPIPCDTSFAGSPLWTQWATVLSGASPCPILPPSLELSYSNRLEMTINP